MTKHHILGYRHCSGIYALETNPPIGASSLFPPYLCCQPISESPTTCQQAARETGPTWSRFVTFSFWQGFTP